MKRNYILAGIIAAAGFFLTACNDAEYTILDNSVYIADAASSAQSANVSMEVAGADVKITVRLAKQVATDVEVQIGLNAELIDAYNQLNSTEYKLLPSDKYSLGDGKVVIPAGNINAVYTVHIAPFDLEGNRYALPVVLTNVIKGDIDKSDSQSQFIYLIAQPLIVSVPVMKGYNNEGVDVHPDQDWNLLVPTWSIECWARMSAYSKNNQAIFDNWGDGETEVYIRFGDANAPYNYLQIKTLGGQVQTARDLVGGVWYHWAFVYNGTTLYIYRNGELDVQFDPPASARADGMGKFQRLKMIGSGATYFPDQCAMSQVRFWKTPLTQTQIKNNMYYAVDATNPNLIAYWPMDEGSGNVFRDITGNGNDAQVGANIIQTWEHNVRFDK